MTEVLQATIVGDAKADAHAVLAILSDRGWDYCFTGLQLQRVVSGRLAITLNCRDACAILVKAGQL